MRKIAATCLISALLMGLSACGTVSEPPQSGKLQIVATVFPSYDFAREIAGERAEVTLLVPPGSESHSFEPTPHDLILLSSCALLVCNGGESEAWLETVRDGLDADINCVTMLDCVNALEEELKAGMQQGGVLSRGGHNHSHEHEHAHDHENEHEQHELEYDEHVWTSPRNAILICRAIADKLCELDPEGRAYYEANCADYTAQLKALDESFRAIVDGAEQSTVIFADRFPVRYFVEEYGLDYYAAFPGCADDAEPSARTVAFLIDKVREEHTKAIFYIEFSNEKMADIICEETGCEKLLFHSCHNITADELAAGVSYMELMQGNLASLKEALG